MRRTNKGGRPYTAEDSEDRDNPFPGPQSYTSHQWKLFFARDQVIDELTAVVLSSSITLLNAPSGFGKSSLLEAGLVANVSQYSLSALPVVRFGTGQSDLAAGQSSQASEPAVSRQPNTFTEIVGQYLLPERSMSHTYLRLRRLLAEVKGASTDQPSLLILDQFERVFHEPSRWPECEEFFEQISDAVEADPQLRIVIGIRSDYLAEFMYYEERFLRSKVNNFALDSLTRDEAWEVVDQAFHQTGFDLPKDQITAVLDELFRLPQPVQAPTRMARQVNLILLQIFCRRLWQLHYEARMAGRPAPGLADIEQLNTSVGSFVDDAIARVVESTGVDELSLRSWLAEDLIINGHRGTAAAAPNVFGFNTEVVDALDRGRLINVEWRNGGRWAELVHDTMVDAVIEANQRWAAKRRRARRKWRIITAALLVLVLLSAVRLAPSKDRFQLVSFQSRSVSSPTLATFRGRVGLPIVRVDVAVSSVLRPEEISLVQVGSQGPPLSSSQLVSSQTGTQDHVVLLARTDPGHEYRIVLKAIIYKFGRATVSVRAAPLAFENDAWSSNASREVTVPSSGIAVALPKSGLIRMSAEPILPNYDGGTEIANFYNAAVIDAGAGGYLYIQGDGSASRKVILSKVPNVTVPVNGPEPVEMDPTSVATLKIPAGALPVAVRTECSVDMSVTLSDQDGELDDSYGSSSTTVTVISDESEYYYASFDGSGSDRCSISMKSIGGPAIAKAGSTGITLPAAGIVVARTIQTQQAMLLTVPAVAGLSASLRCHGQPTTATDSDDQRLNAYVPAKTRCILVFKSSELTDSPSKTEIDLAAIPGSMSARPR